MTYKALSGEHQPQPPLPPGTGIVCLEYHRAAVHWSPVLLVDETQLVAYEHFYDPYGKTWPLSYRGRHARRKAIGYLWRRWRRHDLEYTRHYDELLGQRDYCAAGCVGNLYQHMRITVAEAAERLALPKRFILKLIKRGAVAAYLHTSKSRSKGYAYFDNYYTFNLAHLEAYLDRHGYGRDYPSYAERQRALGTTRTLPVIIWCV